MRIGLIAEGPSDLAVLTNIIRGVLSIDSSDIEHLRPRTNYDNTFLAHKDPDSFSSWSLVKQECIDLNKIESFLALEGNDFVVIHLDTAEANDYEVEKPSKQDHEYSEKLRNAVIQKVFEWTNGRFQQNLIHAIAIEEIDAWVLTIYEDRDTSHISDPKKVLQRLLAKSKVPYGSTFSNYSVYSESFRFPNQVKRKKCLSKNVSLLAFCRQLENIHNPESTND